MTNAAWLTLLLAAGALAPGAALGQEPAQLAMARPQPHFVAAWAPKKEREAERSAVLARRVPLELTDVSLDAALKALTNQAGLRITYSPAVLPAGKRVTISASDVAVVTALTEMLFRSGLDVVVDRDGALALVVCRHQAREAEVQDSGSIVGAVTDRATGSPLAGATVLVERTQWNTTTDGQGRFRLVGVVPGAYTVRTRYIGYAVASTSVTVEAGEEATADFALEKSVQRLEDVVTTGTIVPTEVKALPTPVTVITGEDLTLQRPRTLQELFRQAVPGAVSWDYSGRPVDTDLSVRGATTLVTPGGNQMKVFIDGLETSYASYLLVDPKSIERIEVIRGPQAAAIYGSDAIGGVMQIFTKRGDPGLTRPQLTAQAEVGMVGTPYDGADDALRQSYDLSVRGGGSDMSYQVGASYSRTGNWLPNGEQSTQSSPSVHGGTRYARGILSVDVSGRYTVQNNPDVFNPAFYQTGFSFFSQPLFSPTQYANLAAGVRLNLSPVEWWQHTITAGVDQTSNEQIQSRIRLTTPDDTLLRVFNNSWIKRSLAYHTSVHGELGSGVSGSLTAGVDHYYSPQTSFGTASATGPTGTLAGPVDAYRLVTKNTGYFAQGMLGLHEALFLTAGLRAEQNTEFGDSLGTPVSPRVGLSYSRPVGSTTLKVRGSWGRAIRAPSPNLKLALGINVVPNPNLGPERQEGWDAGVDAAFGTRGSLSITYFDQTAKNLIQGVPVPEDPLSTRFENVGRVRNTGIEIESSVSLSILNLKANYAYTRARVADLGPNYTGALQVDDQIYAIPKHTAGALLAVTPHAGTTISAGLAYVGDFANTDALALFQCIGGTGPCTPDFNFVTDYAGFVKINAGITHQIAAGFEGFVSVDNVTNTDASEGSNFLPAMGRISTLGFRYQY